MDPLNDTLSVGPSGCLTIEGIRVGSKGIVATKPAEDGGVGAPTEEKVGYPRCVPPTLASRVPSPAPFLPTHTPTHPRSKVLPPCL